MIRELKTLIAVAREGTFSAAGEKIGLTQAAVSAQMQRLEAELGFALFDRTGRSAQLNAEGRRTLAQAEELVRLYSHLGAGAGGDASAARVVAIGAIASAQRSVLPDVLARFHKLHDDCRTRVVPGVSMALFDQVDAGELDMALIIRPPFSMRGDLRWTTLAREPFRLLVPRKLVGDDWAEILASQPFVRYDRASFGGRQVERFLRASHLSVRDVCEVDEIEAIVGLVARGVGVALVPQVAAQAARQTTTHRWPAAVRVVDMGHHTFHREVGLVHRGSRSLSPAVRSLAQLVCAGYPALEAVR